MTGLESLFAAHALVGIELNGGWRVVKKLEPGPDATGGTFCVQYLVEKGGRTAFCKVLDVTGALTSIRPGVDPARLLQFLTDGFNFERDIVAKCRHMTRVVTGLDDGFVDVPNFPIGRVNYIIFERADNDIRQALSISNDLGIAGSLRVAHNIAAGLDQLHSEGMAHQDMKPSNALVFTDATDKTGAAGKVGDLGRAYDPWLSAPHDRQYIPGDKQYAPPELLYKAEMNENGPWRILNDVYQLGSLLAFVFVGVSMNALLAQTLSDEHHWNEWADSFDEVLPYLEDAFGRAVALIASAAPPAIVDDLTRVIRGLCNPDPDKRGLPGDRTGRPLYDLKRTVTALDLMARRTQLGVIRRLS